jgi:hypothetical protein
MAAEQEIFGVITTGAEQDPEAVTRIGRSMVGRWGMSSASASSPYCRRRRNRAAYRARAAGRRFFQVRQCDANFTPERDDHSCDHLCHLIRSISNLDAALWYGVSRGVKSLAGRFVTIVAE